MQSVNHESANQSVSQSCSQWIRQSVNPSVSESVSPPCSQSVSQSVSQRIIHFANYRIAVQCRSMNDNGTHYNSNENPATIMRASICSTKIVQQSLQKVWCSVKSKEHCSRLNNCSRSIDQCMSAIVVGLPWRWTIAALPASLRTNIARWSSSTAASGRQATNSSHDASASTIEMSSGSHQMVETWRPYATGVLWAASTARHGL